jgi:phenylalanyl-tRNA synthetase beta chain
MPTAATVTLRPSRAAKVIGMPITQARCVDVMTRLGFAVKEGADAVTVTAPPWRFDLRIEEDLIEEVARLVGYDHLPDEPPRSSIEPVSRPESVRPANALRRRVAALGYQETINYSFVEAALERDLAGQSHPINVLNPIAAPMSVMRSSLLGGLLGVLRFNVARRATRVRVFELGRVFWRDATVVDGDSTVAGVNQPLRLAGLAWGEAAPRQWATPERNVDFFDVKGDVESLLAPRAVEFRPATHPAMHPGRCAEVVADGAVIGHIGELHPRSRQSFELASAPVMFELDLQAVAAGSVPVARPVPRQQTVWRDLALVVRDGVSHRDLVATVRAGGGELVRDVTLFDVYKPKVVGADMGADERSMAIRVALLDDQTPLTDERIEAAMGAIVARLGADVGARLRA